MSNSTCRANGAASSGRSQEPVSRVEAASGEAGNQASKHAAQSAIGQARLWLSKSQSSRGADARTAKASGSKGIDETRAPNTMAFVDEDEGEESIEARHSREDPELWRA